MTPRSAPGVNGPVILAAWCETCGQESMPMRDGSCGWCDRRIVGTLTGRESRGKYKSGTDGGHSANEVAAVTRTPAPRPVSVRTVVPHKLPAGRRPIPSTDLIAALQHCAVIVGGTPTLRDYDRVISRPSHRTVWRRFGSWSAALDAAGLA